MLISTSHRTQESALKSSRGPHNNSGTITTTLTLSVLQVTSITNMWCDVETSWPQPSFNNLLFLCYCLCWGMIVSLASLPTFPPFSPAHWHTDWGSCPGHPSKSRTWLTASTSRPAVDLCLSPISLSLSLLYLLSPSLSPYIVIKNIVLHCNG